MFKQCINLFKKPQNHVSVLILSFFLFLGLRIIPVYHILRDFYRIPGISLGRKVSVFYEYVFLGFVDMVWYEQIFIVILSFATAINIVLFVIYFKKQKKFFAGKSFFAALGGIFLGVFGVGCLSCGVLALAPLLTLIGLGAHMSFFQNHAFGISLFGLVLVFISIFYLLKKIQEPIVCQVTPS